MPVKAAAPSALRGLALVESLIALTLLSLGLASTVSVLVQCLRHEREAGVRSLALRSATSLGEELRALRAPDGRALLAATGTAPDAACAGRPAACPAEDAAATALAAWRAALELQAPAGAAAAVHVADPEVPAYRITITWPAAGAAEPASLQLFVET